MNNVTVTSSKPNDWRVATVTQIRNEAPDVRSYCFVFEGNILHNAGQHYEVRLTAENGYQAARLYSAAMPANGTSNMLELTIALMPGGEVSPYIFHDMKPGSQIEIRGPLGRYFEWTPEVTDPVLLIGGGTGVIPLRSIRLQHQQSCMESKLMLLYSVKSYEDMLYKYELFPKTGSPSSDAMLTFTKEAPQHWTGYNRRIDKPMIEELLDEYETPPLCYVCGPTPMVESATQLLVSAGIKPGSIKAERFGPTN